MTPWCHLSSPHPDQGCRLMLGNGSAPSQLASALELSFESGGDRLSATSTPIHLEEAYPDGSLNSGGLCTRLLQRVKGLYHRSLKWSNMCRRIVCFGSPNPLNNSCERFRLKSCGNQAESATNPPLQAGRIVLYLIRCLWYLHEK